MRKSNHPNSKHASIFPHFSKAVKTQSHLSNKFIPLTCFSFFPFRQRTDPKQLVNAERRSISTKFQLSFFFSLLLLLSLQIIIRFSSVLLQNQLKSFGRSRNQKLQNSDLELSPHNSAQFYGNSAQNSIVPTFLNLGITGKALDFSLFTRKRGRKRKSEKLSAFSFLHMFSIFSSSFHSLSFES